MEKGFVERAIGRRSNITLFVGTQMLFTRRCHIWSRNCLPFWCTWVYFWGSCCSIFNFKLGFFQLAIVFVLRFTTSDYPLVSSNFSQVSIRVTEDIVLRVAINFHFRLLFLLVICSDNNIYRGGLTFIYCFPITVSVVHFDIMYYRVT
jgi:hypothetical protein